MDRVKNTDPPDMRHLLKLFVLLALLSASAFGDAVATLRSGDVFGMRITGVPSEYAQEFTLEFTVGADGTVNVPLIGEIKASGMTPTQLERAMQNRFMAEKIFTHPTVIIMVATGARFVSISGGVRAPQRLPWSGDLTLSSAIGNCQGLSDFGSGKGIRIVREGKIFGLFNLKDVQADPAKDPKLLPGDQVVVKE
jgi:protein involved in polysaccharide export with SLBB domain